MFEFLRLLPVMVCLAAAIIVPAAVTGLGVALVRAGVAACLVGRRRIPPILRRLYRASQPARRHYHFHASAPGGRWTSRAEE
jgi:hypothetical protein